MIAAAAVKLYVLNSCLRDMLRRLNGYFDNLMLPSPPENEINVQLNRSRIQLHPVYCNSLPVLTISTFNPPRCNQYQPPVSAPSS
jgi:hypothetical protein